MSTLAEIEKLTSAYSSERSVLSGRVAAMQRELEEVRNRHIANLKRSVGKCAERHAELKAAIEANPELFTSPKSLVFSGIRVGYKKGQGSLEWEDDAQVVKLIKKHFPDQAELLIITKETPSKEGLEHLGAADLKKLGVSIEGAGEQIIIKPTDTGVDKLVKGLLKEAESEADERKAAA